MSPDPQPRLPRPLAHASLAAMAAAALLSSSCATQPFGDQKGKPIFASFGQCMAANGVGAVLVGVLTSKVTNSTALAVAAAAGTLFYAWRVCGQAHQKVVVSDEKGRAALAGDARLRQAGGLSLDELSVASAAPGQDIVTRYRFSYLSADAARKDIAAREKFVYLAGVDDGKGGVEFKEIEFERDFVVQQGQRTHEHAVPSEQSFGSFKPWKLRYSLEIDGQCQATEVTFAFQPGAPARAAPGEPCAVAQARWSGKTAAPAAAAVAPAVAVAAAPARAPSPAPAGGKAAEPTATLARALRLQESARGNFVKNARNYPAGTAVTVLETQEVVKGSYKARWSRVRMAAGEEGWTLDANLRR